ncbi:MAG: hypothetical protein IMW86_06485 [Hydrogenibacillus sp.]|nr:hypothetical protein [Hydrogenibacillus sp.]
MKRAMLTIAKTVQKPFYEANVAAEREHFYNEDYRDVWVDAEAETGHRFTIAERVALLKESQSVVHFHAGGTDYFFNKSLEDYWFEIAELIEDKYA